MPLEEPLAVLERSTCRVKENKAQSTTSETNAQASSQSADAPMYWPLVD